MSTPPVSDEDLAATVAAYEATGRNQSATALAMGLARETVQSRLKRAAERGLCGPVEAKPGYILKSIATKGADGSWVKQTKEPGPEFVPIDGHTIKGESALVDAEGRVIQKWVKTREERTPVDWAAQLQEAFKDYEPKGYPLPAPTRVHDRMLSLTPLADWHVGLKAWAGETGTNWDLAIAERVISGAMEDLVSRSPASRYAIVLGGGDLLHSDNNENKTSRSGNVLQVDDRYDKCLDVAERLVARTVDLHLQKHGRVIVRILKGNHDEHSSVAIAHFLKGHYRHEPRVFVDTDASLFFWKRFGKVLIGATHGHEAKVKDMPSIMAHRRAEDWGQTIFRYVHGFHLHHSSKFATEGNGCISEVHQTPTPQDAWHYGSGFLSGRSLQSISYDALMGEEGRVRVAIRDVASSEAHLDLAELDAAFWPHQVAANDNEKVRRAAA